MFKMLFCLLMLSVGHLLNLVLGAQDFYWRDYAHGVVPHDAFEGQTGIYVGQVYYSGRGLLPATIYPHRNAAVTIYGTRQNIKEHIKILCSPDTSKFYWDPVDFAKGDMSQMRNAVRGGFQDNNPLYIGIIKHEGDWKIGKVKDFERNDEQGLYVWDKTNNHVKIVNFQLLKYNLTALPDFPFDVRTSQWQPWGANRVAEEKLVNIIIVKNNESIWNNVNAGEGNSSKDPHAEALFEVVDSMQHFYWRDYRHGEIPCDAFEAAPGVYIGQVLFDTGLYVATIYPYRNSVVAMRGPRVDVTQSIKIFCTSEPKNFYWQSVNFSRGDGIQMIDAVHGGYQEQRWEQFIGRVEHLNNWKVGKVYDIEINDGPGMYVWGPDGDKVVLLEFELLKSNATTTSHECSVVKYRL